MKDFFLHSASFEIIEWQLSDSLLIIIWKTLLFVRGVSHTIGNVEPNLNNFLSSPRGNPLALIINKGHIVDQARNLCTTEVGF